MELPSNTSLPFFAYGIFRKGQISYPLIKQYIENPVKQATVKGRLLIRDGVPILDSRRNDGEVLGDLIEFISGAANDAYKKIAELEPGKQYYWGVTETNFGEANVLMGRSPDKGADAYEVNEWNSWDDPLFKASIELIEETIADVTLDDEGKQFLRLQMAYMLLWAAIERFIALRYIMGGEEVMKKIARLAENKTFVNCLKNYPAKIRKIYKTTDLSNAYSFEPEYPKACIDYYYQIRSNVTHRGKAAAVDAVLVSQALSELTEIFKEVLRVEKLEANED